ncbi:hypothetical protein LTR84_002609 [Exophiala bonariae]|uniref:Cytochrome P450 n=1 Tax=Exophiala bonariae TaxID=1690606 RepID=A0AAV9NB95_9EURO|nr:hypothetical protein LTR84_002609 [Exophiala bonariae]
MLFLDIAACSCIAYVIWTIFRLQHNYVKAKKIGLPIIFSPVNVFGPLWLTTKGFLGSTLEKLPFGLGEWVARTEVGWTYHHKFQIHAEHGEAFIIVSPAENEIVLAEPNAAEEVMRRRNDFIKNPAVYGMLDVFGPNLDTVNGKVWDRHRKITVPPFNEKNSALVWRESGNQAEQLLQTWCEKVEVRSTQPDIFAVALNVLCEAGFGVHSKFVDEPNFSRSEESDQHLGYRECLRLLLSNFIQLVILNAVQKSALPTKWLLWGRMKKIAIARDQFLGYMTNLLAIEQRAFDQGDMDRHNLMSALVRAQGQSQESDSVRKNTPNTASGGLSDGEVYGNLFIYSLAGHDTTAGALHFAIVLLAVNPELQDWVGEEIDAVRNADPSGLCFYEETFPKLVRCLALMYETARLHGPVVMMPRYVDSSPQRLQIHGREHIIPPHTTRTLNFVALHTHPEHWGPDPLSFRPSRWIVPDENAESGGTCFLEPTPGSYVPWNSGPRVCPGRKFSQVEFVRVVYGLFAGGTRVQLVREPGESLSDARDRALRIVNEAKVEVTLKMVDAYRIGLKWVKGQS